MYVYLIKQRGNYISTKRERERERERKTIKVCIYTITDTV